MKFGGKVEGFDQLDRLLKELPRTVENQILQKATTETLKEEALPFVKAAAPVHKGKRSPSSKEYGTLKSNIRVSALKNKKRGERGAVIHTGKGFWGYILEKGSRYIAAAPWFFPAFQRRVSSMTQTLGEKIGRGIEERAEKSYRGGR